jgi:16S rRNA (guanine(966)-N(2))-methyltransferase RsmD
LPRIIAGLAKGIILETPQGMKTRPTSDRAKEALFSILRNIYEGKAVLDLYSGTGSLGIEALSRGAQSCIFVDRNRKAVQAIRNNLNRCKLIDSANILAMDASKAIGLPEVKNEKFACIFMDPPYDKKLLAGTIEKISQNDIIDKKGILVVEHSAEETPPDGIYGFACYDRRNYGTVNFSFYRPADG